MLIFTVENNRSELGKLKETLERLAPGEKVCCFSGSPEALAAARENTVDTVFLSTALEEMDGRVLGRYLKDLNPRVNLVFLAGAKEEAFDAMVLRASGCILKPVTESALGTELRELRYKEDAENRRVFIQTFGDFEIFADGKPVAFKYSKTKEMMSVLVSKRGAQTTNGEIIATLWEDDGDPRIKGSYLSNLRQDLQNTLAGLQLTDIISKQRGSLAIVKHRVECDLFDWLDRREQSRYRYLGDFMSQYSWSDYLHAELDDIYYEMDA